MHSKTKSEKLLETVRLLFNKNELIEAYLFFIIKKSFKNNLLDNTEM